MYFELQLSSNVFTRIVRNRLKAVPLCIDREQKDLDGTPMVVDRVIIGETTLIQREKTMSYPNGVPTLSDSATQGVWIFSPTSYHDNQVPFLQVVQEVNIQMVKTADLDANGPNPSPVYKTLPISLVFNISLNVVSQNVGAGGPLRLAYSLAYINYGLLGLVLNAQQRAEIEQAITGIQLPPTTIDIGPLSKVLKRPVTAINAGIACDPAATLVALRVDFDVYTTPPALNRQFFEAGPVSVLNGKEWAMLIDANLLVQDATAKARNALQNASKVRLDWGPTVSWDPSGPAIDIRAGVELVDACPFFIDDIDMDADVDIRATFSAPAPNPPAVQPNTFRTHFHLTGEPSNTLEEVACALTGALLWPFIGPVFLKDEDIGEGLGAYFGGLALGPVGVFIAIIVAAENKGLSKDISNDLGDNCKKQDDENYECNDVISLGLPLAQNSNARLDLQAVSGVPEGLVLSGVISNMRDYFLGSLEPIAVDPFKWQILGGCTGNGANNFRLGNQAEISVYGTPPAGMCRAYVLYDPQNEFILAVDENTVTITPRFTPGYMAAPYPCKVRIITNMGVRTITLAPPQAITGAESEELEIARLRAVASCYYWEKYFMPWEEVRWLVDPPFRDREFVHFWQVVVRGMREGESIHVGGRDREPVMTANPSRAGVAHLAMMFPGQRAPEALALELRGGREDENDPGREISIQQVLYEQRASLPVNGPVQALRFERSAEAPRLVIREGDREIVWDVSEPMAPALVSAVGLMETGERGRWVNQNGRRMGAEATPKLLQAVERLEERLGEAEAVGSPRVGGVREALYLRSGRYISLFDITEADEPCEMQVFEGPAWYEGVALGGRLMARYNAEANTVDIFYAARIGNLGARAET